MKHDELWDAVKARRAEVRIVMTRDAGGHALNRTHRRKYLLSGLLKCGLCGGGLAATLFADARYLKRAIARRHFRFPIDRAILLTALAVVAAIWLWRLIGSRPL